MLIDSKENVVYKYFDNVFSGIIISDKETRLPILIIKYHNYANNFIYMSITVIFVVKLYRQ